MPGLPSYLLTLALASPDLAIASQPDYDLREALGFQTRAVAGASIEDPS